MPHFALNLRQHLICPRRKSQKCFAKMSVSFSKSSFLVCQFKNSLQGQCGLYMYLIQSWRLSVWNNYMQLYGIFVCAIYVFVLLNPVEEVIVRKKNIQTVLYTLASPWYTLYYIHLPAFDSFWCCFSYFCNLLYLSSWQCFSCNFLH